jgi:hypothetical protein
LKDAMRYRRFLLIASLLTVSLTVSGCESFDPSDWFNPKKPLPGERKEVFPGGVPGVPEGVPPELVKGYQPPAEPQPQVVEAPPEQPNPRPKAKPKPKPKPKPQRAAAPVQRAPAPAAQQQPATSWPAPAPAGQSQPAASPWPTPQQTTPQSAPAQPASPWPDPPRPGSFQR